jgi:hypothetical protein
VREREKKSEWQLKLVSLIFIKVLDEVLNAFLGAHQKVQ